MSINLDDYKDYERSHNYVKAAKYHAGASRFLSSSNRVPGILLAGVKIIIKSGAVVPEDIDYIKSIVGIDKPFQDIH